MEFDLHTHTSQGSACSRMHVLDLVQAAVNKGLAGVCITDHDYCWYLGDLERLTQDSGIQVYAGVELSTVVGELLIYGVHQPLLHLRDNPLQLRQFVASQGGVVVAAHPFRQDFVLSTPLSREECGLENLDPRKLAERRVFGCVDSLEVYNGRSSWQEIQLAQTVAGLLGKKGIGGSDAHSTLGVGSCITVFHQPVLCEADLLAQLARGSFSAKKRK